MTVAEQLSRLDALLEPFDAEAKAFLASIIRARLEDLPEPEADRLVVDLLAAADAAGTDPFDRLRALSRPSFRATTPERATHTIAQLIHESDDHTIVGAVEGLITDTWRTTGYTEYRLSDGDETLVMGVRGRSPRATPPGQRVIVTVQLPKGAQAITEPIDPRKPSVLGAVAGQVLGFRTI